MKVRVAIVKDERDRRCPDTRRALDFWDVQGDGFLIEEVEYWTYRSMELWGKAVHHLYGERYIGGPLVVILRNGEVIWAAIRPSEVQLNEALATASAE